MLNEQERSNVTAATLKFLALVSLLIGAGMPLVQFLFHISLEFKSITERLAHLL